MKKLLLLAGILCLTAGGSRPARAWYDSYSATYLWNFPSTELATVSDCDECSQVVTLPWAFPFYGKTYTQVTVYANGYIYGDEYIHAQPNEYLNGNKYGHCNQHTHPQANGYVYTNGYIHGDPYTHTHANEYVYRNKYAHGNKHTHIHQVLGDHCWSACAITLLV